MIRYRIWSPGGPRLRDQDGSVILRLCQYSASQFGVEAVYATGRPQFGGMLIEFVRGTIVRQEGVSVDLGFDLEAGTGVIRRGHISRNITPYGRPNAGMPWRMWNFGKVYERDDHFEKPTLRLLPADSGASDGVMLCAVFNDGTPLNSGRLIRFTSEGKIHIYSGIDSRLPISRNHDDRIEVT